MNQMKQNIGTILIGIAFLAAVGVAAFFTMQWKETRLIELRNKAISDCAEVAVTSGGVTFNGAVYKICVEDKKYETQVK